MKRDSFLAQQVALLRRRTGGGVTQLTGDVSAGPGTGSQSATIANDAVTNAKLANMAADTIKGRANGAGTGDPQDLTANQVSTILDGATDPFVRTSAGGSYTDEQAQDAVGTILADTATVDLTYRDIGSPPAIQADVRNASITLAKIQNASANSRLVGSGSAGSGASYSEVSLGSNLTMSGTTLNVTTPLPGGSGGGLVLLEEHIASSSATLDFTTWYSSTYDEYEIHVIAVIPATDATNLYMTVSTDGGANWSATSYRYGIFSVNSQPSTGTAATESGTAGILIGGTAEATATASWLNSWIRLCNPGSTTRVKGLSYDTVFRASDGRFYRWMAVGGWDDSANNIDALRFAFDSGNIAEGTIRIYGVAKS